MTDAWVAGMRDVSCCRADHISSVVRLIAVTVAEIVHRIEADCWVDPRGKADPANAPTEGGSGLGRMATPAAGSSGVP
jgi:hypothetical protein